MLSLVKMKSCIINCTIFTYLHLLAKVEIAVLQFLCTVEPPSKGHFGAELIAT